MDIFITILTGIMTAAASAWVTVQLSLRRFRAEKWWERRVTAYERVIEALYNSKEFSEVHLHALDENLQIPKEQDNELRAQVEDAAREIAKAVDLGSFLLVSVFKQMEQIYV